MDIYVARQPIFDQEKKIFGYELLFRDSMKNVFSGIDGNTATSKVLSNSFLNIGIEKLIGSVHPEITKIRMELSAFSYQPSAKALL